MRTLKNRTLRVQMTLGIFLLILTPGYNVLKISKNQVYIMLQWIATKLHIVWPFIPFWASIPPFHKERFVHWNKKNVKTSNINGQNFQYLFLFFYSYCGYIEQYKYHVGDTYGNGTRKLAQNYTNRHPITSTYPHHHFENKTTYVGTGLSGTHDVQEGRFTKKLPKSTGDNKLTEKMVPGYTGM